MRIPNINTKISVIAQSYGGFSHLYGQRQPDTVDVVLTICTRRKDRKKRTNQQISDNMMT